MKLLKIISVLFLLLFSNISFAQDDVQNKNVFGINSVVRSPEDTIVTNSLDLNIRFNNPQIFIREEKEIERKHFKDLINKTEETNNNIQITNSNLNNLYEFMDSFYYSKKRLLNSMNYNDEKIQLLIKKDIIINAIAWTIAFIVTLILTFSLYPNHFQIKIGELVLIYVYRLLLFFMIYLSFMYILSLLFNREFIFIGKLLELQT